jgi:hypothetical protein
MFFGISQSFSVWICLSVSNKRIKQTHIITLATGMEMVKRDFGLEEEKKLG